MTITGVAFDCCWLVHLEAQDLSTKTEVLNSIKFMRERGIVILLDGNGHILKEYDNNLLSQSLGKQIWIELMKEGRLDFRSGLPSNSCVSCLDSHAFDLNDRPYIAVAQAHQGYGVYLTDENKHLEPSRVLKIAADCGVPIIDTDQFIAAMRL